MKIRIEHTNNPLNYGTNMMVANFMYYLNKEMRSSNKYKLDVFNDEDLNLYKKQYSMLEVERETIDYNFYYSSNIVGKIINRIKREYLFSYFNKKNLNKLEKNNDILVILGGDDLSEYYPIEALKRELFKMNYIKNKLDVILVGQTIGPFKEERKELVKNSLDNVKIYSRDPWTKEYLESKIGLKGVIISSDLALLPLPGQENNELEEVTLRDYDLISNEYITIVPSGLYKSYCEDEEVYVDNFVKIINYIKQKTNYKIVLLPHVLRPDFIDDRNIIKKLEEKFKYDDRIKYIYDVMSPLEARFILGNGKLTITGRMHGAINTLQMRKPAISISYSVKYDGVIGRDLGLSELIVKGDNKELWLSNKVANNTIDKIDLVLNNYKNITTKIDNSVLESEKNINIMIKDIASKINEEK